MPATPSQRRRPAPDASDVYELTEHGRGPDARARGARRLGRALTAHPAALDSAIVLERTASPQSTAVRLEADGVTPREREIAVLLARGLTNPEIAETLVLSLYTVQDHVKRLFEKTGVSSSEELVARIFLDDYMPRVAGGAPLSSTGGFAA